MKLLDFGIAKVMREGAQSPQTVRGEILGTPAYMAPEQALGMALDPRVDLYGVGACMYEMIAGRKPLLGTTSGELLLAIARQVPPKLDTLVPEVDARLSDLVDRALSKDPERRPTSAAEMIEALSPWAFSAVNRAKGRPREEPDQVVTLANTPAYVRKGAETTASLGVPSTVREATVRLPAFQRPSQPQMGSTPPAAAPSQSPPPFAQPLTPSHAPSQLARDQRRGRRGGGLRRCSDPDAATAEGALTRRRGYGFVRSSYASGRRSR